GWAGAGAGLRAPAADAGLDVDEAPGEAAFYGPKIDVQVRDAAGREWSLSTVQLDFHQPARFGLEYLEGRVAAPTGGPGAWAGPAAGGGRRVPAMVHRSVVGSMERLF